MVERSPEKAGVGGSIPSLATIPFKDLPRTLRPLDTNSASTISEQLCSNTQLIDHCTLRF